MLKSEMDRIIREAKRKAGYREKFAIKHGNPVIVVYGNKTCIKFDYSFDYDYQDANGATYEISSKRWIG